MALDGFDATYYTVHKEAYIDSKCKIVPLG